MLRLRWLRIVGDTVFLSGVASLVWFALGLWRGWSYTPDPSPKSSPEGLGSALG